MDSGISRQLWRCLGQGHYPDGIDSERGQGVNPAPQLPPCAPRWVSPCTSHLKPPVAPELGILTSVHKVRTWGRERLTAGSGTGSSARLWRPPPLWLRAPSEGSESVWEAGPGSGKPADFFHTPATYICLHMVLLTSDRCDLGWRGEQEGGRSSGCKHPSPVVET